MSFAAPVPLRRLHAIRDEDRAIYIAGNEEPAPMVAPAPQTRKHITMIDDSVVDRVALLGPAVLGLYTLLERRVRKDGTYRMSYNDIADQLFVTRRYAIELVKKLVDAGFVEVKTLGRGQTANLFYLPNHGVRSSEPTSELRGELDPQGDAQNTLGSELTGEGSGEPTSEPTRATVKKVDKVVTSSHVVPTPRSSRSETAPNPVFALWRWWADQIGMPPDAKPLGKDLGIAKQLVNQGVTLEDAADLYHSLVSETFWMTKGVDLGIMLSQLGKYRSKKTIPQPLPPFPPDVQKCINDQLAENTVRKLEPGYIGSGVRDKLTAWFVAIGEDPQQHIGDADKAEAFLIKHGRMFT